MKNALRHYEFLFIEGMMPGEHVTVGDFVTQQIGP
jgi:hypothetical protein